MVVWRGGKGMLVPGIGWLCGGEVRGISAMHWMVVWRWKVGKVEIPTNEIATMSVKLPYILHWPAQSFCATHLY